MFVKVTTAAAPAYDPSLDLHLSVDVPITAEQLFEGWTDPAILMQWFCPRPWQTVECDIDLRPGGGFTTVMQSPEGQRMPPGVGCYLIVEKPSRLVWTNLMGSGFRPVAFPESAETGFGFVCELSFTPLNDTSARFEATLRHTTPEGREQHQAMGFDEGWRTALAQLVAWMQSRDASAGA
jgi:uncharacterized protein YndB with AHSA1/START domain